MEAYQVDFIKHAGCRTLSSLALQQWLVQQGHVARALTTFIGSLIGKIRLLDIADPQGSTNYRAFDLLVSTLNNRTYVIDSAHAAGLWDT